MRVLGIDTGLRKSGYAVVDRTLTLLDSGVISTDEHKSLCSRLKTIYEKIKKVIENSKPDIAVYETLFFNKNPKTLSLMSYAQGVLLLAAEQEGLKIEYYTPAEIKKNITGNGRATKSQVRYMVEKFVKGDVPESSDVSDAIACALCYLLRNKATE